MIRNKVYQAAYISMVWLFFSCTGSQVPKRPDNIPAEAAWVGGDDGGVWMRITERKEPRSYRVKIFDQEGALWKEGLYTWEEDCKEINVNLKESDFNAFDGEKILLHVQGPYKMNCSLVEVK